MSHIVYTGISVTHRCTHTHTRTKESMAAFIYLFMFLIIRVNSTNHMVSPPTTFAKANLTFVLARSASWKAFLAEGLECSLLGNCFILCTCSI